MIQCETCLVWQHSVCVGIREDKAVPPHYFCEICLPRNFRCSCGENTPKGRLIECSGCNTWQHIQCLPKIVRGAAKHYRCSTCDPESLFLNDKKKKPNKKQNTAEDNLKAEEAHTNNKAAPFDSAEFKFIKDSTWIKELEVSSY